MTVLIKDLASIHPTKLTKKSFGVEIEIEGRGLIKEFGSDSELSKLWSITEDNSLRGESAEFIFRKPLSFEEAVDAVNLLYKDCLSKSKLTPSIRCGVHVHYNVQNYTPTQLWSLVTLFLLFEEVLVSFCGDQREGNMFCLRSKDAEFFIAAIRKAILKNDITRLFVNDLRYSALNLVSLGKFGSVEFRSLPTTVTPDLTVNWLTILKELTTFAFTNMKYPDSVLSLYSDSHAEGLITTCFPKTHPLLLKCASREEINKMIVRGFRSARLVAKTIDWSSLEPTKKRVFEKVPPLNGGLITPKVACIPYEPKVKKSEEPRMQVSISTDRMRRLLDQLSVSPTETTEEEQGAVFWSSEGLQAPPSWAPNQPRPLTRPPTNRGPSPTGRTRRR